MIPRRLAMGLLLVSSACGPAQDAGSPDSTELAELACRPGERGADLLDPPIEAESVAGPGTSDELAAAKRLFDNERWNDASVLLMRITSGRTNADAGAKQLAQYFLGICHMRLQRYEAAFAEFDGMAREKNHMKHNESLLWLVRLLDHPEVTTKALRSIGQYESGDAERFNNPQQRELYWKLQYAMGRIAFRLGKNEEAVAHFERVDKKSPQFDLARDCLVLAKAL